VLIVFAGNFTIGKPGSHVSGEKIHKNNVFDQILNVF
jgi:hypothetical protein